MLAADFAGELVAGEAQPFESHGEIEGDVLAGQFHIGEHFTVGAGADDAFGGLKLLVQHRGVGNALVG